MDPLHSSSKKRRIDFKTEIIHISDVHHFSEELLRKPAELIKKGEVVAFPTETVYGLGANALSEEAVSKIFQAKGRPSDNPLIVHVSSMEMLKQLIDEEEFLPGQVVERVCNKFWPGPLTILFKKSLKSKLSDKVTAGLETVAVRMPSHPVAKKLIELSCVPIAAPSANISGRPSPTNANHVIEDLEGIIPCIIDGGSTDVGLESTVINLSCDPPLILRPGGITFEDLKEFIPTLQIYSGNNSEMEKKPPTPGLKYRHYSPRAKVLLFEENSTMDLKSMKSKIEERVKEELIQNKKVAIINTHSSISYSLQKNVLVHKLGKDDPKVIAQGLFGALRELDNQGVDVIFVEGISEKREGLAVMNRIRKAASETVQ